MLDHSYTPLSTDKKQKLFLPSSVFIGVHLWFQLFAFSSLRLRVSAVQISAAFRLA
jgi:hypothetical protein